MALNFEMKFLNSVFIYFSDECFIKIFYFLLVSILENRFVSNLTSH